MFQLGLIERRLFAGGFGGRKYTLIDEGKGLHRISLPAEGAADVEAERLVCNRESQEGRWPVVPIGSQAEISMRLSWNVRERVGVDRDKPGPLHSGLALRTSLRHAA